MVIRVASSAPSGASPPSALAGDLRLPAGAQAPLAAR
jgi:hypothetical protein